MLKIERDRTNASRNKHTNITTMMCRIGAVVDLFAERFSSPF